jgi:hypothetical protein
MARSDQPLTETEPIIRLLGRPQFLLQSFARGDVQALCLFHSGEQLPGPGGVVPVTLQLSNHLVLLRNKLLAMRNKLLDLHQVLFDHCPSHLGYLRHGLG